MDVTQRGALRDSTKRLRRDTSKSLANVSGDGQLIFYRIRSKLLFPLKKKIDKLMFSIRRLYANMSSAYASDTSRSVVERTAKGMRSEAQPIRCLRRVRESSHVFLGVFFTVGKMGT